MAATSTNGSGGASSSTCKNSTETKKNSLTEKTKASSSGNGALRFKDGPYLTPKVERIMLQIARGRSVEWIAHLYDVRESFVYFVARKTGFPASAVIREKKEGLPSEGAEEVIEEEPQEEEFLESEEDLIPEAEEVEDLDDAW